MNDNQIDYKVESIREILKEQYISGIDEERIMYMNRITSKQLDYFVKKHITITEKKKRASNRKKFRDINVSVDTRRER